MCLTCARAPSRPALPPGLRRGRGGGRCGGSGARAGGGPPGPVPGDRRRLERPHRHRRRGGRSRRGPLRPEPWAGRSRAGRPSCRGGAGSCGRGLLRRRRRVRPGGARAAGGADPGRHGRLRDRVPLRRGPAQAHAPAPHGRQPGAHGVGASPVPAPGHRRPERLPRPLPRRSGDRRGLPRLQLRPGPHPRPGRQGLPLRRSAHLVPLPEHRRVVHQTGALPAKGGAGRA